MAIGVFCCDDRREKQRAKKLRSHKCSKSTRWSEARKATDLLKIRIAHTSFTGPDGMILPKLLPGIYNASTER